MYPHHEDGYVDREDPKHEYEYGMSVIVEVVEVVIASGALGRLTSTFGEKGA
jgi:hypothetical protein